MKKIHYILGTLALVLSACSTDDMEGTVPAADMVKVRISTDAAPEIVGDTRTALVGKDVIWHADDAIAYAHQKGVSKMTNIMPMGASATFEGEISDEAMDGKVQMALYPYMEGLMKKSKDGKWGIEGVVHSATQQMVENGFACGANISVAAFSWTETIPTQFKNVTALVGFELKGNTSVKRVVLTAPDNITGEFAVRSANNQTNAAAVYMLETTAATKTITMISNEDIELSEEGKMFYATVVPLSSAEGEWTLTVTTTEGQETTKTLDLEKGISMGYISTFAEPVEVYGDYFVVEDFVFAKAAASGEILKTKYLTTDYTVASPDSWITPTKSENGVTFTVTENTTGAERNGSIVVTTDRGTYTFAVRQTVYDYYSAIGEYAMYYKNQSNKSVWADLLRIEANEVGKSYKMTFNCGREWYYTMILDYVGSGESWMTLSLPQKPEFRQAAGKSLEAWAHASKVPAAGFKIDGNGKNVDQIDITDEGVGYNLVLDDSDGKFNFLFKANAKAVELYGDLGGIYFPLKFVEDTGLAVDRVKDYIQPVDGELKITLHENYGDHEGFTKKE